MKRFVKRIALFFLVSVSLTLMVAASRVLYWQGIVRKTIRIDPDVRYLFIGDSHIGCTFVEAAEYRNKIIYEHSMPQQFTLMWLREMERAGSLKNIDAIILDIGLQSIGQQKRERMCELWWRMIPVAWRYYDAVPLSSFDRFWQFVCAPNGRISIVQALPTVNVPVTQRSMAERESDFRKTAGDHFRWVDTPELMCTGWEESLKAAISEINEICLRNNIDLVFITAPLTDRYIQATPVKANAKLVELTDFLKAKGIRYYDIRRWGEEGDFRDCFHFRHDGAKKFTSWFYTEILDKVMRMRTSRTKEVQSRK